MSSGNISAVAIRHPIPPIVLFIVLIIAGIVAYFSLDVTGNPDLDFPVVTVTVSRPGAAPSEMEVQVTKLVEDAVSSIVGLDHVSSDITDGLSNTVLEFKIGYDTDRAVNDVRNAISRIRANLPSDIYEPQVERQDVTGDEILTYAVASDTRSVEELSWLIDNEISRAITHVPGVGATDRFGGLDREIRINLDPNRLMARGITADEVNSQLRALNVDLPGGRGAVGTKEQSIRTLGSARTVEELANTEITIPVYFGTFAGSAAKVRLSDLGTVTDGTSEMRYISRYDGQPTVGFSIRRAPHSSEVTIAKGVDEEIGKLSKQYPDVHFNLIFDNVKYTKQSFAGSVEALVLGSFLAVLVVWWFLRDGRATFISALAMPLSTIPTFLVMKWFGFSLNGVTLLALSLVVGILVDDAIVEIENIVRHIRMGKRPFQAALEAADEIGLAVVATTMTIVVVFLPVSFMSGIVGQYFKSFGVTVAVAVLFSLLVARLITPLMAAYMLKPAQPDHHSEDGRWMRQYSRLLGWSMSHRWLTVLAGVGIFAVSLVMAAMLPSGFVPPSDNGLSTVQVILPPGATLAETDATTQMVGNILAKRPEVLHVWTRAGRNNQLRNGAVTAILKPKSERMSKQDFEAAVTPDLNRVPGAHIGFNSSIGWGAKDISVLLTSNDGPALERFSNQVLDDMRQQPFLANVTSTAALLRPEIQIRPFFDRAAEQGVSVAAIGQVAKIATLGDLDTSVAKFNLGDRQVPIRVQIDPKYRSDMDVVENLRVRTSAGDLLPLRAVASIGMGAGAVEIERFDRARKIAVEADLRGIEVGEAMKKIDELPSMAHMPPGISKPAYGQTQEMQNMMIGFAIALATAFLLILAVLILLFRNFFQPLTIMTALPLSFGGAFAALMIGHMSLSLPALIGILMLMGIVTKNSILLVEYAIVSMRDRGMSRREALLDAGAKRARPIIMTTIAMVAGMVPIAIGVGNDSSFQQPMATAVIGGLITSTLLSLVFVPAVFTIVDDINKWLSPKFGRFITPKEGAPHAAPLHPVVKSAE
ncbi:efflux RND transporter permease subunit [Nitrospirillum sp. BR 11828]|uniref:efflux RND transporter permease subunit n=1 Tax=Nitrospirillum sp. BR 11828 TaxID=3104325 RepID=UPI002ACABA39|nr:efflux RND transporter permease subunit [Nitrospirillum sp. BR 11828]MDZ5646350.1 efflux RND transporter permease subunit [Nitrospirillum sp. BR 11828]